MDSPEIDTDERDESQVKNSPKIISKNKSYSSKHKYSAWNFLLDGWNLYFTSTRPQAIDQNNTQHQMIITLYNYAKFPFFKDVLTSKTLSQGLEITLDYQKAMNIQPKNDQETIFKQLMQRLQHHPDSIIGCLGLALYHQNQKKLKVFLGISNFLTIDIKQIKPHMVRTFIAVRGTVLKVGSIKLLPVSIDFKCSQCKNSFTQHLIDGVYQLPQKCKFCKSKVITCDKTSIKSIRNQRIKIQQSETHGLSLEVELRQNLVGKMIAGDTINISGILKAQTDEKDKKTQGILSLVLFGNHLINQRSYMMTEQAESVLKKMRNDPFIFISLIKSFCPAIFGHELVKAGLLLGIVGGTSQSMSKGSGFRQNSHILLLGDPGLGKSQLLKFATNLLSNSIYISGSIITQSGLTVTVNKDGGQSAIQAGALVLCDKGVCGIDQFDKISDTSALLQAMQQQTVSIAKAGIICQLQSRVTILASANPIHGSYIKAKSLKQNIKISNAILSRFDLIFLLLDKPDPERDLKLSSHIMKIHNKTKKSYEQMFQVHDYQQFTSLSQKYQKLSHKGTLYSPEQLKHYLSFVRSQIHPQLTPQAAQVLKCFYMSLRSQNMSSSVPITTRQLQSLIRLSMAKARLECRSQITKDDAQQIIQFMQESLFDALEDISINANSLKNNNKKTNKPVGQQSIPKQAKAFIDRLHELGSQKEEPIWDFKQLMQIGRQMSLSVGDFDVFIDRLNQNNTLILRPGRKYQLKIRKV